MTKAEAEDLIKINKKLSMVVSLLISQNKLIFGILRNSIEAETWEGFEDAYERSHPGIVKISNELKEMDVTLK